MKPRFPRNGDSASFTLVELLVVVAIIGVLAALLAPALKNARIQAKTIACVSTIRQVATGMIMYAEANEGQFPHYMERPGGVNDPNTVWTRRVIPYVKGDNPAIGDWRIGLKYMYCPAVTASTNYSYGANYTSNILPNYITYYQAGVYPGSPRQGDVKPHAMMLCDMWFNSPIVYNPFVWPLNNAPDNDSNTALLAGGMRWNGADFLRHNGKMVVAYFDGSAGVITLQDWKTNKNGFWGY